jgi:hypothetical protein
MSPSRKGARLRLSPARRLVVEYLHHARKVPSLPLARSFNVADLARARSWLRPAPSWFAVFMKAMGLVARHRPELRRAFLHWPYPRLYEHPQSECAFLVEREWAGEPVVLGAKVRGPEDQALADLDAHLCYFKETPVWEVSPFRQALRLGRVPWLLRRFTFWHLLNLSGYRRAKHFGTFMMSSLGGDGIEQIHPLTFLTTYFTFGRISPAGAVEAKLIYDHRVMDGGTVARCLNTLDEVLHTDVLAELRQQQRRAA